MSKYTAGPWIWVKSYNQEKDTGDHRGSIRTLEGENGEGGYICAIDEIDDLSTTKANTRLITATPDMFEALEPFTHEDLLKLVGGNTKGQDSIVFQRDKAILRIRDFVAAAAAISKAKEEA